MSNEAPVVVSPYRHEVTCMVSDAKGAWFHISEVGPLVSRLVRAERSLQSAGWQCVGGEVWKPPLGRDPSFELRVLAELRSINQRLDAMSVTEADIEQDVTTLTTDVTNLVNGVTALQAEVAQLQAGGGATPDQLAGLHSRLQALITNAQSVTLPTAAPSGVGGSGQS